MTIRLTQEPDGRWLVTVNSIAGSVHEDVTSQINAALRQRVHQEAIACLTEVERAKLAELADLKESVQEAVRLLGGQMGDHS